MKIFGHRVSPPFLMLGVTEFAGGALSFLLASWVMIDVFLDSASRATAYKGLWAVVFGLAVVLGMLAMGLYQPKQRLRTVGVVARQVIGLLIAAVILALSAFFVDIDIPGSVWALSIALTMPALFASRVVFAKLSDRDAFRRRVLILGAGERASALLQLRRRSDQRGFRLVAFIPAEGDKYRLDDPRVVRKEGSLLDFAQRNLVNEIVVAMDDRRRNLPIKELLECRFAGIDVVDLIAFFERETGKVALDIVMPDWLIFSGGFTVNASRDLALRAMDLIIVTLTSVISIPIMLAAALAVYAQDGRPVLYRQRRAGLKGEAFTLYKFRSMVKEAESDGQPRWASRDDERVTRVGRVLRKYRIDELPQLFNVLKGDMSLVGPRPERPEFVERLSREIPYYAERHCVKPGITGWAQMSYPYASSEDDAMAKLAYDLYYVKHRSLIFNIVVLLQTAEVVLWSKGAR